ncbi:MAG: ATP-grasp domain-containing protein [Oscillospiraceae bacterium]|nr:ATP-grasp domain-containing protein [Oscillospiraceae bacterium]
MRIWFNHWFSTAYHIINLMKGEGDMIIGTSSNPQSVVGLACDEWYIEPQLPEEEYVKYCLDFCREHNIEVFVPRRGMAAIARNAESFEKMGVKLLMDTDPEMLDILHDKLKAYKWFESFAPEYVPMYYEIKSIEAFRKAYQTITAEYERACFKFAADEGAVSFRVIDNFMSSAEGLYKAPGMKVSYENAEAILSEYSFEKPLIMMPYLTGVEVSADCLYSEKESVMIPRYKSAGRLYTVKYEEEIVSFCEGFLKRSGLKMPCNIQFKYHNGKPYLLEVNTRMSGGIQLSCLAAEINIPRLALERLMGKEPEPRINHRERQVSYIESPVLVGEKEFAGINI